MTDHTRWRNPDIDGVCIPPHTHDAIVRYIEHGIPMGHFGTAVLCNDLKSAVANADDVNYHALADIAKWIFNYAPAGCWGSPQRVKDWIARGGLHGYLQKEQ